MALIGQLSRAPSAEPAQGAAHVAALSRAEVAALMPETVSSRLARRRQATAEDVSDSDEGGATSFFAPLFLAGREDKGGDAGEVVGW